jgi:hypothetical protein
MRSAIVFFFLIDAPDQVEEVLLYSHFILSFLSNGNVISLQLFSATVCMWFVPQSWRLAGADSSVEVVRFLRE